MIFSRSGPCQLLWPAGPLKKYPRLLKNKDEKGRDCTNNVSHRNDTLLCIFYPACQLDWQERIAQSRMCCFGKRL